MQVSRDHRESGKHDSIKEYSKPPIIGPKEVGIQELPTKNSKQLL